MLMKDDPVYYISDHGPFKPPMIWPKRKYWTIQIIQLAAGLPVLAWLLTSFPVPLWPIITTLTIGFVIVATKFYQGREKARRYKREQEAVGLQDRPHG